MHTKIKSKTQQPNLFFPSLKLERGAYLKKKKNLHLILALIREHFFVSFNSRLITFATYGKSFLESITACKCQ